MSTTTTTKKDEDYCMRNTYINNNKHVVVDIGVPHTIIPIFIVCCC
jgi:hypothetical protein